MSIGQKLVLERDRHKAFSSLVQVAIMSLVCQQPCMYFAFLQGRKIAGIMPRAPTLLSLTFKNQKRPVKILKNFIFLIIHDAKAALHSSGNPGWQNSTKTRFLEQKMSFSLYHLHRLDHPGKGKTSCIYHRRRQSYQSFQIIMYFC